MIPSHRRAFLDGNGRKRKARVEVGKPERIPNDPNGNWFCPVYVEGFTPHVTPAIGVGPLDALMNAMTVVRGFRDHVGTMHIKEGIPAAERGNTSWRDPSNRKAAVCRPVGRIELPLMGWP